VIAALAETVRFLALVISGAAGEPVAPAVILAGVLVSAAIVAVILCRGVGAALLPPLTMHVADDAEVLARVRQRDPDAAGHSRSRAPGLGGVTAP
jgi:Family of unknown function (DUF6412)